MGLLSRAFTVVKDAVFPPRCSGCGSFFHSQLSAGKMDRQLKRYDGPLQFTDGMRSYLCTECLNNFSPIDSPICSRCGKPFKTRAGDDHECEDCIRISRHFNKARAAGVFDQSLMHLIHQLKYKDKIHLAKPLGRLLRSALHRFWDTADIDLIIPVPLHRKRLQHRRFNQTYLLIKQWQKNNTPCNHGAASLEIDKTILTRERHTKPQTGLSRKERIKNIKNAFRVTNPKKVNGKRILVVDDVYTTGATTNECARVLLKHGAKRVDVLTLARAV